MSANSDLDPRFIKALELLHCTKPTAATEMRILLDEMIKERYGASNMLCNTFSAETLESWESNYPGMQTEPDEPEEIINLTNSPPKTTTDTSDVLRDADDAMLAMPTNEEVENLKEFGDLNCCVCADMMFTATNRLIECAQCGALYHQECHKPAIADEEITEELQHSWQCSTCNDKPTTSKAALTIAEAAAVAAPAAPSPVTIIEEPAVLVRDKSATSVPSSNSSSSNSNSSSPYYKQESAIGGPPAPKRSKHTSSSSSTSKSRRDEERTSSSSKSSSSNVISVLSATDRVSSSSSSSRKSSSQSTSSKSKSSSRHHESSSSSSSSRRKTSK